MKSLLRLLFALLALPAAALSADKKSDASSQHCGCACCQGKETCCCQEGKSAEAAKPDPAGSHPLKGVIVDILPARSALLVKHEEIPGVMRAMTMMFQVESPVLERVKRGDAIRARMQRRDDGWWLLDIEVVTPPAK
jgi:Cu/Ag efflux protein CusF